jgi:hypothetical protein
MLKMLLIVLGSVLAFIALFMLYFYDTGLEFGYYRQYYRAKHMLESMPNVRIVAHHRYEDTVLERFGFTLLMDGTREVQVNVDQHTRERRTWSKSRLHEFIERQIDANQPPESWQKGLFPDSYYERSPELKAWRRRQPDPVPPPPQPIDPNLPPNVRRTSRLTVPRKNQIDSNQPAGQPARSQP